MATETVSATAGVTHYGNWKGGVVAGVVGGVVFGAMLSAMMTPVIEMAIPALYGLSGGLAGWIIHVSHGAVLGVVFAAVAGYALDDDASFRQYGLLGVAYGVVLWAVLAAIVMPIWLGAVGFPNAPPLPNFNPQSLVGHVVYGVVVGLVYPQVRDL